jgi:hypothetical protein
MLKLIPDKRKEKDKVYVGHNMRIRKIIEFKKLFGIKQLTTRSITFRKSIYTILNYTQKLLIIRNIFDCYTYS